MLHQNFRLPVYRLHPLRVSWGLCVALVMFGLLVTGPGRALAVRVKSADGTGVDGEVAKTRTDAAGRYHFENLPRGTHKVTLDPTTLPPSLRPAEGEAVPTLWVIPGQEQTSRALASGVRFTAAYHQDSGAIAGLVFWDRNDDGLQGPGEMGLAGVTVIDPTIHQYFVPFNDRDLIEMFRASNTCQQSTNPVSNTLTSGVSLVASTNGTVYYYDHWEDGYDPDPLQPGPTTEVGTLDAGKVRLFSNDIDTRFIGGSRLYYDGRDRITVVGGDAAVIRYAYPSLVDSVIGPMLAGAWEIEQTANWGTAYVVPAGEDWGLSSDFAFTGASIMALQNNTQVYLNGSPAATLNTGVTFFVNGAGNGAGGGGLDSGDTFTATAPIMGHMYSSVCAVNLPGVGGPWAGNGYTLEPTAHWTSDYWSPVTSRISCDGRKMDIFVYNPGLTATLVVDNGTVYNVSLPPGSSSVAALIMPSNFSDSHGVHLYTPGGEPFWGVANFDTLRTDYEWGYSLMPAKDLSAQVLLGWSPGNSGQPPLAQYPPNGNLAWVTPVSDTVVFVDLNGDGNPDRVDCNGDGDTDDLAVDGVCDEPTSNLGITLTQGQTLRVADPTDADLSGAFIYSQDLNKKIAVAWGEDSCVANYGLPYLDLGYTVLPLGTPYFSKSDALAQDVDQSGDITPGDLLTYTIVILNSGMGPMNNVVMTDVLPYTTTDFVVGSIDVTVPPPTSTVAYDDGSGLFTHTLQPTGTFGVDPAVQQLRITWPQINGRQTVTVALRVQIQQGVPPDVRGILNQAIVSSSETPPTDSGTDTPLGAPVLQLTKLVSSNTVRPGGLLTYTVVVSNVGTATALSAVVLDDLPPWMTYISGTLDLTWPVAHAVTTSTPITRAIQDFFGTVGDNFDNGNHTATTGWTGNDGTISWMGDWSEVFDDGAATTGDVQVLTDANANSPTSYLRIAGTGVLPDHGLRRCADLSQFVEPHLSYKLRGDLVAQDADDFYRITVTSTVAPTPVPLIHEIYNGPYVSRDLSMSAYAGYSQVCITFYGEAGLEIGKSVGFDDIFIYEASHARYETVNQIRETTVISYSRVLTDPVSYTRIPSDPNTPAITHTMQVTQPFHFPASSQLTATFQIQVALPLTNGLTMTNTACVTATNWITPTCDDALVQVVSGHALSVTKSAQANVVLAGAPLTYTIAWGVTGDEPALDVTISDTVPANTTLITASLPVTVNGALLTWPLGTVLPPASGVVTLVVQANGGLLPGTLLANAVIVTDTSGLTGTDTITTPVTIGTDLAIFKSDEPDPVIPGTLLTYTLVAVNLGPTDAAGVVVTDTLPPQVTFVSATPTPSSTTPLTWFLGALTVGETRRLTVTVQVSVAATQTFTNTAVVGSDTPDDYPPNNRADEPTTPLVPGLDLSKSVTPGEIVRGMPFTYTIRITNTGQITLNPVVLTDTLPPDFYYVTGSGVPSSPDVVAEPLLRWNNLGTLTPGASLTVAFAVTATQGITGTYVNTATVAGHHPGGVLTDTDNVPVVLRDPAVAIQKQLVAADLDPMAPNLVTFTIAITNIGPTAIAVLPLLDQYDPYYLAFAWANPMPDEPQDDGLLTWYDLTAPAPHGFGRDLPPGEAFHLTTVFTVAHDITTTYNSAAVGDAIDVYQNPTNRPTDTVPIVNTPTAVELLYFRVDGVTGQQVRLTWATAVEIDNYGFNLYRADVNDPARARLIHFEPSALRGPRPGATYVYVDTVPSDGVWWYWLADVDTRGNETRSAQATANVGVNLALPYKVYLPILMKGP